MSILKARGVHSKIGEHSMWIQYKVFFTSLFYTFFTYRRLPSKGAIHRLNRKRVYFIHTKSIDRGVFKISPERT